MGKICKRCGLHKELSEFYTHSRMGDGHLNICKACKREEQHRYDHSPVGHETERRRNQKPVRRERLAARARQWRKAYPDRAREQVRRYPEKYRARTILNNAVRDGQVIRPEVCEECGRKARIYAHHKDYGQPLVVEWLCVSCHRQRHQ